MTTDPDGGKGAVLSQIEQAFAHEFERGGEGGSLDGLPHFRRYAIFEQIAIHDRPLHRNASQTFQSRTGFGDRPDNALGQRDLGQSLLLALARIGRDEVVDIVLPKRVLEDFDPLRRAIEEDIAAEAGTVDELFGFSLPL